jgi:hypothetical protein
MNLILLTLAMICLRISNVNKSVKQHMQVLQHLCNFLYSQEHSQNVFIFMCDYNATPCPPFLYNQLGNNSHLLLG